MDCYRFKIFPPIRESPPGDTPGREKGGGGFSLAFHLRGDGVKIFRKTEISRKTLLILALTETLATREGLIFLSRGYTLASMPEIAKLRYTHDAVIDEILADPSISQGELAGRFGYTQSWMSIIINSDAFKEKLAERRGELVDPRIQASISERLDAVARRALDKLLDKLDSPNPIKNMELVAMAKLGVGEAPSRGLNLTQNNYVVNLPPPAASPKVWLANVRGNGVQDISHSNPEP